MFAAAMAAQADMSPIDVPYQAIPAFRTYTECVSAGLRADRRSRTGTPQEVRQANLDAIAACRAVRAEQLARGVAAVGDKRTPISFRTYKSRADAQAAVGRAFDRFDADFKVEDVGREAGDVPPPSGGTLPMDPTTGRPVLAGRLDIPDEIAPAVIPYLLCLNASAGVPMYRKNRERPVAAPQGVTKGSDCGGFRRRAADQADRLLRERGKRKKAERTALIESTLAGIEEFQRSLIPAEKAK